MANRLPHSALRFLRHTKLQKPTASVLIGLLGIQVFMPGLAKAHSGPKQPEYLGYESSASTEMVNPLTGDFTYNIPLLEVPGPEGGFSMPLTYRAGIKLEDEASWVGLGWSLNPGAIVRQVNNYPDDASGEVSTFRTVNKVSGRQWDARLINMKEQSVKVETGFQQRMEQLSWALNFLQGPMALFISVYEYLDNSFNSAYSTPTYDFEMKTAMYGPLHFGRQSEWADGSGTFFNAGPNFQAGANTFKAPVFRRLNPTATGKELFEVTGTDVQQNVIAHKKPTNPNISDDKGWYAARQSAKEPASIAYDNFQVMGPGISGIIKPYRLETGSVCVPNYLTNKSFGILYSQNKYNPVPFLEEEDYKVGFRYEGYPSNTYQHHTFTANETGAQGTSAPITLTDTKLYQPANRIEASRNGLVNTTVSGTYKRALIQGRHINWYTNKEIFDARSTSNGLPGFMECPEANKGNLFNSQTSDMRANNPQRIGAFAITAESGITYHYSLPVYNYYLLAKRTHTDGNTFTTKEIDKSFAQSWLLTGITGPDYVDKAPLGIIGKEDLGYWVKLEYGRYNDYYLWRQPFSGGYEESWDSNIQSSTEGERESYYLNAIKTRTHTAIFIKEDRTDAIGAGGSQPSNTSFSMKLSEIILLKNEDIEKLESGIASGTPPFNLNTANNYAANLTVSYVNPKAVYDMADVTTNTAIRDYIYSKMLKRIVFNYDYSLCDGIPNSYTANGKLTLKSIKTYFSNNTPENEGYKFGYGYNPYYGKYKFDAFGCFFAGGLASNNTKKPLAGQADQDGAAWSVKYIVNPTGVTTAITYERDTYSHISENLQLNDLPGEGIRVRRVDVSEGNSKYSTRYFYTDNLTAPARSTGVITREPASYNNVNPHYNDYDYPSTPVMYSKVTALTGPYTNPISDYNEKTEYHYHMPESSMLSIQKQSSTDYYANGPDFVYSLANVTVNTGLIGQPKAIYKYNNRGEVEQKTVFSYTNTIAGNTNKNSTDQGKFTESTIASEYSGVYIFARTIKTYMPTVLASITTTANNITGTVKNEVWDFFTGQVTESSSENGLGVTYWNKKVMAYEVAGAGQNKKHPGMGLKGENEANKNMLVQEAEQYVYKNKKPTNGIWYPFEARVQTWNKDWSSYRVLNTSDEYIESSDGPQVWRPHRNYAWKDKKLNPDGTLQNFTPFDWAQEGVAGQNAQWLLAQEITRYNAYSRVLESRDMNGNYTATKTDNRGELVLTAAQNARYTEIAFSGAEDETYWGLPHFGGEVRPIWATRSAAVQHTGQYSLALNPGGIGFVYRAATGPELTAGRRYRVSVWVYQPDNSPVILYAHTNGAPLAAAVSSADPGAVQAGDWKLLNLYFQAPGQAGQPVEVYCKNNSGNTVRVDDFRFQPVDAPLTANVFDPLTWKPIHTLDNDNLYTAYDYTNKQQLAKIYRETPGQAPAKKLAKEYIYHEAPHKVYYNTALSGSFRSKNCQGLATGSGTSGFVPYTLPAMQFSSEYSQEDAQTKAQDQFYILGQSYANAHGDCDCLPDGTVLSCISRTDKTNQVVTCKQYNVVANGSCGTREVYVGQISGICSTTNNPCIVEE